MLLYVGLYLLGVLVGLAATLALDVQLRRPGLRQAAGALLFALLLWGVVSVTHTPFTEILLPLLWLGTGFLAGVGSRATATGSGLERAQDR